MGINEIKVSEKPNEYGLTPTQCSNLLNGILHGEPDGSYFFAWEKKQKNAEGKEGSGVDARDRIQKSPGYSRLKVEQIKMIHHLKELRGIPEQTISSSSNGKRGTKSNMVTRNIDNESIFNNHTRIDLGCGDGASAGKFVDTQEDTKRSSVTVVDQSPGALGQASNILQNHGIAYPSTVVGNFCEYSPTIYRPSGEGEKLFTIFGQTIGNLSADDVEKLVFLMCINTGYCVFDFCHSIDDPTETLKLYGYTENSYDETHQAFYDAIIGYLSALGMQPNDINKIHYHVQRDKEKNKVDIGFKTNEDIVIHGKVFKKGVPYTVIHSWRRSLSFYEDILKKYGAKIIKKYEGGFSTQCVVRLPGHKNISNNSINDMLSKQPNRKDFMSDIQGRKVIALDTSKAAMYTLKSLGAIGVSILFLIMSLSKPGNNDKRVEERSQDSVTVTIPDSSNVGSGVGPTVL